MAPTVSLDNNVSLIQWVNRLLPAVGDNGLHPKGAPTHTHWRNLGKDRVREYREARREGQRRIEEWIVLFSHVKPLIF
jgi:hypothetical protein